MTVIAESPIAALRSEFRRINRGSVLRRVMHAMVTQRERAADRVAILGMLRVQHQGALATCRVARRPR